MGLRTKIIAVFFLAIIILVPFFLVGIKSDGRLTRGYGKAGNTVGGHISEGEVLGDILSENGIGTDQAHSIFTALQDVFDVRRCNLGDRWELTFDREGNFEKLAYFDGPMDFYEVTLDGESGMPVASANRIEAVRMMRGVRGKIASSLYESMSGAGVNPELIIQFAEIFASKMDFFTDCKADDEFGVLWESYMDGDGNVLKDMRISAASYTRGQETLYAFYFDGSGCKQGYYDEQGINVEALFLKAPLNYRRISSYYTQRRFHPILKRHRPHLGIDYAAAQGTPVSAIGDGIVTAAGRRKDGLGVTVVVKHPNACNSWYGHLSGISKGTRQGARVQKGQVIGYVGSTGIATGPHLDFRLQKNGKFVNFLALSMPPSDPLPASLMKDFETERDRLLAMKDSLKPGEITVAQHQ